MELDIVILIVSVLLIAAGVFWRGKTMPKFRAAEKPDKRLKSSKRYSMWLIVLGGYIFVTKLVGLIFGPPPSKSIEVSIPVSRVSFLGHDLSSTVILTWGIMAALIILALILRFTVLRNLSDVPTGAQNVLELAMESILKYTKSSAHHVSEIMASYVFTVAVFLCACAVTEMIGFRTPASDITMTGALAIMTFFLINYYGIKVKGIGGRISSMAQPVPVVFPIKIITDCAVPVSLACRLFGNMLGGLVVMDLVYTAMGNYAVGVPSLLGLYFSIFHPLIQAFIFVTLTLNFINEATE